ncbi:inositol monophosphatase [Vibrio nigripulchritudo]|uniref:inositol monophosphatase family protein n=1 Tax=Vibrio nigripulchritudo TaxID=28173 RepID=UPI00190CEB35|nr:inositol monophosphatase [Vibrio nigripulchritudo]BCL73619.1 inositol monophosphatase [Vibrio nigripulchritudo]BDU34987.1 inositol monophosphatase [Vibrio nigripulchritudo]
MNITLDTAKALVGAAREVAKKEVMPYFRKTSQLSVESKSSASDLVTTADKNSEKLLSLKIAEILPEAEIIGEEAVENDPSLLNKINTASQCVIIDPIDGTWNFVKGVPVFGIIIAVVEGGETVCGVLYDPVMDNSTYAVKGKGAYHIASDGEVTPVYSAKPTDSFTEMEGFVPAFSFLPSEYNFMFKDLSQFERINTLRCSCHEYRTLSEGGVHFGISGSPKPWDNAAGELVFRESGGYAAILETGKAYKPGSDNKGILLLAPNKENWQKLQQHFLG